MQFGLLLANADGARAITAADQSAVLWQIVLAAFVGSLFFLRPLVAWMRRQPALDSQQFFGFLFASGYAAAASLLTCFLYRQPVAQFEDIFVAGIILTAYLFTWESSAFLLVISLLVAADALPPYGDLAISRPQDLYRVIAFGVISVLLIPVISRLKARGLGQLGTAAAGPSGTAFTSR